MHYRLAFLSGATSGLGRELAFLLAEQGIPLFLTAREEGALHALQEELEHKVPVLIQVADLTSSWDLECLLKRIRQEKPDLIINNAGLGFYGDVLSLPLEKQLSLLQVNIYALTAISIEGAKALGDDRGTLVNISSLAANYIYPSFAVYAASKRFVKDFSLAFDEELKKTNIRVLVSLPGRFPSAFQKKAALQGKAPSSFLVPLPKMARCILRQIERQKRCVIHDKRYQLLYFLSLFLPQRLLSYVMRKQISSCT